MDMKVCKALFVFLMASVVLTCYLVLSGCAGMPTPGTEDDCMFILMSENPEYKPKAKYEWKDILDFEGPTSFSIEVRPVPRVLHFRKIMAGEYRLKRRYLRFGGGITRSVSMDYSFKIEPNTIYLSPRKIVDLIGPTGSAIPGCTTVLADDQRWAAETTSDYINFREWIGSNIEGFGPYTPRFSLEQKAYDFRIDSEPSGATVFVDDVDWGTAPISAKLEPGKHQLALEKEGYAVAKTFIDVESEGEVTIDLTALEAVKETDEGVPSSEKISLLLVAFKNIGSSEHDRWRAVFPDVLRVAFSMDKRLEVIDAPSSAGGEPEGEGVSFRPDFSYAEQRGIDLLVAGHYLIRDEKMMVHASLFDVRSEMVKTSVTYTGQAGILVFNSVDSVANQFISAVDKVLPPVGMEVVQEKESMKSQIISYDKKLSERQIIDRRIERRFSLSGGFIWGAMLDTLDDPPFFDNSMRYKGGPALGAGLTAELTLVGPLSLTTMFNPVYFSYGGSEEGGVTGGEGPSFELPLYIGPRYSFMSTKNDLYFGLLGQMRYVTGITMEDELGLIEKDFGPYWITGVSLDTGIKIYMYRRMSAAPTFFNIGMLLGAALWRFEQDFSDADFIPLEMWIYFGFGSRL
jgi:hypothetical protein